MRFWLGLLAMAAQAADVTGIVLDASTREPIGKALIQNLSSATQTVSGPNGRFVLPLTAVPAQLQASCTGYRPFKLMLTAAGELEILLTPDTLRQSDQVTVSAGPFALEAQNALSLAGMELRNLASVLSDDPLRAVQGLPGVNGNDDFQSQISLRGASPHRIGIFLDGVLLHTPFHTLRADPTSASLTVISSDLLERAELHSSAPPAQFADRTVGAVDLWLREGDRKKFTGRASASASNASVLLEGPLAAGRGSWLVSARKSYLQYIINTTSDEPSIAFGFSDVQGRVNYDLTKRHNVSLTGILGRSGLDRSGAEASVGINSYFKSGYTFALAKAGSRWTAGRLLMQSNAAWIRERFENVNRARDPLAGGFYNEWVGNSDNHWQWHENASISFGVNLRRMRDDGYLDRRTTAAPFVQRIDQYGGTGLRGGVHAVQHWQGFQGKLHLRAGGRVDRHSVNQVSAASPAASVSLYVTPATQLNANWGTYVQYPELNQSYSRFGRLSLLAERAIQTQLSLEQRLGERTRVRVTAYDRADRDLILRPLQEPRLLNGRIYGGNLLTPYQNSLRGYARGVQFLVQRRSANGFTGWGSYTYNAARVREGVTGIHYNADFDQRHLVNLFLSYRLRPTVNVSGRWTYGSGFPVRAFAEGSGPYLLSAGRNRIRLPQYHRLDVRANKTFVKKGWHVTLFVEVINVYNRDNARYNEVLGIDTRTRVIRLGFEQMFPIIPSAGVALEW
ncbi:MAG: TonB-dependent receptor plug domain-containing protein [Bryobacterales bacterium]|nr:TonB-dependent receptor plug domain-containing protein [Bryobacterales bacterium]